MKVIYSFLQKPIYFNKHGIIGKLFVVGNTKENIIQFKVYFPEKKLMVPLLLIIQDNKGKKHNVFLMLRDENNAVVLSHLYEPEYLIRKGIIICDIRPVVLLQ